MAETILRLNLLLLLFFMMFTTGSVQAVELKDLYKARVKVTDRSSGESQRALKLAIKNVLSKVGGGTTVLDNALFKAAVNDNQRYVTQFGFINQKEATWLEATFDADRIAELFQQANLPVWGRHRPLTLIWLVEEQEFDRRIIADSSNSVLPLLVKEASEQLGLPLLLPLMDLADASLVNVPDVWGRFLNPLTPVISRYNAEANVIIRLSNSTLLPEVDSVSCQPICNVPTYAIDWTVFLEDKIFTQSQTGNDKNQLVQQAIDHISFSIYQHYAFNFVEQGLHQVQIKISNIDNLQKLNEVTELLSSLSVVKHVQLVKMQQNMLWFNLSLVGEQAILLQSLKLDRRIVPANSSAFDLVQDNTPEFSWR